MEGEHDLETRNKITITSGFTRRGVQFKPPTPSSSWGRRGEGMSSNLEFFYFSKVCQPTILVGHGTYVWSHQRAPSIFGGN